MKKLLLYFSFLVLSPSFLYSQIPDILPGQIPSPTQIRTELGKRGYDETEIRRRLEQRGIDLNTVDPTNPLEVNRVNKALQEIIAELDAEKKAGETTQKDEGGIIRDEPTVVPPENPNQAVEDNLKEQADQRAEDIKEAVEDGATIEEAVAEELTDELELPPAKTWGQQVFRLSLIHI